MTTRITQAGVTRLTQADVVRVTQDDSPEIAVPLGTFTRAGLVPSIGVGVGIAPPAGIFHIGGGFTPQGVNLDGVNDSLSRGGDLTDNAVSKLFTFSFHFRTSTTQTFRRVYQGNGDTGARGIRIMLGNDADDLRLWVTGGTGISTVLQVETTIAVNDGKWHHAMGSFDLSDTGKRHLLLDGVDRLSVTTYTNDTIDFTQPDHIIGDWASGGRKWDGDLAQLWFKSGTYFDLSNSANSDLFFKDGRPVDLGSDGIVSSVTPILFFDGDVATWHTNKGSGGGFTESGALTAATVDPPSAYPVPTVGGGASVVAPVEPFSLAGQVPVVGGGGSATAPLGSFTLNGQAPAVAGGGGVVTPLGSYSVTPLVPVIGAGASVDTPGRAFTLAGLAPVVGGGGSATVPAGAFTRTGFAPQVAGGGGVTAPVGAFTLSGFAPFIGSGIEVSVPAGSFSLTGFPPAVAGGVSVAAPSGTFTLTGFPPSLDQALEIFVPAGAFTVTGFAPAIAGGAGVAVPAGAYLLSPQAPVVGTSALVVVPPGELTLTGYVPAIVARSWEDAAAAAGVWSSETPAAGSWSNVSPAAGTWTDVSEASTDWTDVTPAGGTWTKQ